jgi:hypothetical protein
MKEHERAFLIEKERLINLYRNDEIKHEEFMTQLEQIDTSRIFIVILKIIIT